MGGGCCIGDCGFCCIADCGFCCIGDFFSGCNDKGCSDRGCSDAPQANKEDQDARRIANHFAEYKEGVRRRSEKEEKYILKEVTEELEELIEQIRQLNRTEYGGKTLDINVDRIRKEQSLLEAEVMGSIVSVLDERLVITDAELAPILKETDDQKRTERYDAFLKKLQDEARENLCRSVRETIEKLKEIVRDEINGRIAEVNQSMKDSDDALREIQAEQGDAKKTEKTRVKKMYELAILDFIEAEIGEELRMIA